MGFKEFQYFANMKSLRFMLVKALGSGGNFVLFLNVYECFMYVYSRDIL